VISLVHYVLLYGVPLIFINVLLEQLAYRCLRLPALIGGRVVARRELSSTHVLLPRSSPPSSPTTYGSSSGPVRYRILRRFAASRFA